MKKVILTRLVALFMMALVPLLTPAVNTIIYNANYEFSNLTLGTDTLGGVTYTTVNYDGMFNGGEPGMPSLPVDYIKFSVPYNATNFTVTATLQNSMFSNLSSYLVYPCQPARMMNDTTPIVITPPDNSVYNSSSYYPSQNAWVVDEGFLAGENHIVTVAVMPLSYKHRVMGNVTTNQLRKTGTVRLVLSYELSDTPAMYPIIREDTTLRQEGYALTRSMVANPDNVLFNAPTDINMNPLDPNSLNPGDGLNGGVNPPNPPNPNDTTNYNGGELENMSYPYLIVTTPELKHSLRRLAALKRQKGYGVKIVTMDEVKSHPYANPGDSCKQSDGSYHVAYTDDAGKLRQYLKYAYSIGTKYVLFAGDSVPYRKITYYYGNEPIHVPTDLYFSDLHTYWSNNWYLYPIDKDPELFVGRILAKNGSQIMNYTDKLFRYELNPGKGNSNYLRRIFYSEAIDFEKSHEWDIVNESYKKVFSDSIRFLEVINSKHPSGTDIVNELNTTNFGYISLLNHGAPYGIITYGYRVNGYPPDSIDPGRLYYLWSVDSIHAVGKGKTDNSDPHTMNGLNNLINKWYPNICYSVGCTTMPFDKAPDYEDIDTSFGEHFIIGKDYGGPAFLGNTRKGFLGAFSTVLEQKFAEKLHNGYTKIGQAEALSKLEYNKSRYEVLIHNLLGEPEFDIWTDIPQQYNNINITRTDSSLTVTGINMDSTIVSYCDNAGGIRKKITSLNDTTVTLTNVSPNGSVMLYRHNSIPYIVPMLLQNVTLNESQYVIASDFTAGFSVDSNLTYGDVIVKNGANYEIEASGTTTLQDGFKVEAGATFSVIPSSF